MPTRPNRTVVLVALLAVLALLAGCRSSAPSTTAAARASAADRAAALSTKTSASAAETGQGPATVSADTPAAESSGPESTGAQRAAGVTVTLPSLPIGGQETVGSDSRDGCVTASYLGSDNSPIPAAVRIVVTRFSFSTDVLVVGGSGCSSDGRACQSSDGAFTDEEHNCLLPVHVTRDPRPVGDQDGEGVQEHLTLAMDADAHCATADRQQCDDFRSHLAGEPEGQALAITVEGASSSDPGTTTGGEGSSTSPDAGAGGDGTTTTSDGAGAPSS